tara:strand:+ start:616 stop:1092 length:477 start_codon:yes stop_codon:yes gene_type:complete
MKLTKEILERYVKETIQEAWQQKLFGGEEEIVPPASAVEPVPEPQAQAQPAPARSKGDITVKELLNFYISEHMKDDYYQSLSIGRKEFFRLYMLNSKWSNAWGMDPHGTETDGLPKIMNVTKMQSGIVDVDFSDGDTQSWQPRGTDVNQMYVGRRRWR